MVLGGAAVELCEPPLEAHRTAQAGAETANHGSSRASMRVVMAFWYSIHFRLSQRSIWS